MYKVVRCIHYITTADTRLIKCKYAVIQRIQWKVAEHMQKVSIYMYYGDRGNTALVQCRYAVLQWIQ